jgi:hypothetical protein
MFLMDLTDIFSSKKDEQVLNDSIDRIETKITKLIDDREELLVVLKDLQQSLKGITNAWTPESPYGRAVSVLQKHNRYWT